MRIWLIMIAGGLLTYSCRFAFIGLIGDREFPELLKRALRFIPPAVLAAIIFPPILAPDQSLAVSPSNLRLYAAAVAALVAWRTRNILATIVAGMAVLWLLDWVTTSY